jgi:predicted dehydrogenase
MAEKLRIGIVGTSWYPDLMHLPNIKSYPKAETATICGRNRDRAEELAKKYGIPHVFTDYREMIEKGNPHALVVAAPDYQHYAMTMDALDAGLNVLCEKPLACNASHAREMYEKAEAAGVKHMVYYTWRWLPHFRLIQELIDEGFVGDCFHRFFSFLAGFGRDGQYGWRFDGSRRMES